MTKSQDNMAQVLDQLATVMEKSQVSVSVVDDEDLEDMMVEDADNEEVTEKSGDEEGNGSGAEVEVEGVEEQGVKNKKRKLK